VQQSDESSGLVNPLSVPPVDHDVEWADSQQVPESALDSTRDKGWMPSSRYLGGRSKPGGPYLTVRNAGLTM
jgi:hypothetical protein